MLRIVASLIPLLLISACNDNEKNTAYKGNNTVYNGRILNGCGSADETIVRIELTQGPMDCETNASSVDHLHTDLDFTDTAAITIGMQLQAATEGPGT